MEPKRRGRPPKVVESIKPEITEEKPLITEEKNQTRNAYITVKLSMPGYEPVEEEIVILNIMGKLLSAQKVPEVFMKRLTEKLKVL